MEKAKEKVIKQKEGRTGREGRKKRRKTTRKEKLEVERK